MPPQTTKKQRTPEQKRIAAERARQWRIDNPVRYQETKKRWRKNNPEVYKAAKRREWFRLRYGMTVEQYEEMTITQDGKCALCKKKPSTLLVVDHCHKTGKVRGLLCYKCNTGLGQLGDSKALLQAAIKYLN